jgi:hypothetical protein
MTQIRTHILRCFAIVVVGILVAGCPSNDGPLENLGEEIDDAVDELDGR